MVRRAARFQVPFRQIARFANSGRQRLARAAAVRSARSYTQTRTRTKRATTGIGITNQYDRRMIYRKRTMPRRKKRRWKSFVRKVHAVSEKDLGSRTVVRNFLVTSALDLSTVSNQDRHVRQVFSLYAMRNTVDSYMSDMANIVADTDVGVSGKFLFQSGVFDMTVRNGSVLGSTSTNSPLTLEIDVYEISSSVDFGVVGEAATLNAVFANAMAESPLIPGQAFPLTADTRGWTPWDACPGLSQYRLKIWKKTKFFLSTNQTFTYQMRDPRRHTLDKQKVPSGTSENFPGVTRFLYCVWKPTPGYIYGIQGDTARLYFGITRKYLYKVDDKNSDFAASGV